MTEPKNRISALLVKYSMPEKFPQLREELDNLKFENLSRLEWEDWYYARSAVEFRTGNRKEAFHYAKEGAEKFPQSSKLIYCLGQEYEAQGKAEEMIACFWKVKPSPEIGASYLMTMARYCYLWGKFEEAQEIIQPVFDTYHALKIADDHFLYIRGLPFFSEAFGFRVLFALLARKPDVAVKELVRAKEDLADYPFEMEERTLNAVISGSWDPVIDDLETYLTSPEGVAAPAGYPAMLRGVLLSRRADSLDKAIAVLDGVQLTQEDFPWLEDIRTLAKAEAAGRFAEKQKEEEWVKTFLVKQPFLFEPHHVFHFGFLEYQEGLRGRYQSRR